ncbi:MAG: DHH family phosphoesterase [bacterium]
MGKIDLKILEKAWTTINRSKKIVIISHYNPDGDAVGSSLGLYNYLVKKGFDDIHVISPNDFPGSLKWMKGIEDTVIYSYNEEKAKELLKEADLIICLDFNDTRRTKKAMIPLAESGAKKILIDHHPYPMDFADIVISNVNVSSTAELVFHFIKENGGVDFVDKSIAECLYTGILTDTGCFTYGMIDEKTFSTLAYLVTKGVDKDKIYSSVYDNFSTHRMRLMGYSLYKKLEVLPEYRTAFISLTKQELKEFQFMPGDTEGFVNLPFSIGGIQFAVLFIEHNGYVKISFRSKGNFSVSDFARDHFNGGGHKNAAGGEAYMPMNEVLEKFKKLLPTYSNVFKNKFFG